MVVNSDSLKTMRETVKWLTGIMTVPLVQNLIHYTYNIERGHLRLAHWWWWW